MLMNKKCKCVTIEFYNVIQFNLINVSFLFQAG